MIGGNDRGAAIASEHGLTCRGNPASYGSRISAPGDGVSFAPAP